MSTPLYFSRFLVTEQVFFRSKYSFALVNLKPLVPGHVLVVPQRTTIYRLSDMSTEELNDYFHTVQLVQNFIKFQFKADSINIAIQDGPEAGQSVPHLHTHIIPRYKLNNFGDEIYGKLDSWSFEQDWEQRRLNYVESGGRDKRREFSKPDDQRVEISKEDMYKEALSLIGHMKSYLKEFPDMQKWL